MSVKRNRRSRSDGSIAGGKRPATILDVAKRANVSVASVSRALNGHQNVHPETRERVMRVVEELQYVPNATARSLSNSLTHTIGVVVPDLYGEFFSELIRGMDQAASAQGYLLLLSTMHADPALAGQALNAMRGRVDGLIVMAPQLSREAIDRLLPASQPCVLVICEGSDKRPTIGIDNRAGAAAAARHLLDSGRRRLAHIMGPEANFDARVRRDGFLAAIADAGGPEPLVAAGDFGEESGARVVEQWIAAGERFDGIFAANDMMAIGALQALKERGLRVPEDVALVGFDDIPLARFVGLSTMRVHVSEIGSIAVNRLVAMLGEGGGEPVQHNEPPELIVRSSSGGQ